MTDNLIKFAIYDLKKRFDHSFIIQSEVSEYIYSYSDLSCIICNLFLRVFVFEGQENIKYCKDFNFSHVIKLNDFCYSYDNNDNNILTCNQIIIKNIIE